MTLPREVQELHQMAALYQKRRLYPAAEQIYRDIVDFLLQHTHADADLALAYYDLGRSLEAQERIQEAQSFYHRCVAIWQKIELCDDDLGSEQRTSFIAALQAIQDEAERQSLSQSDSDQDAA